jgi:indole-3-pyruvate monooxygenase
VRDEDILVIGAGPAGLAVSASLRDLGLSHVVVERASAVGSSWRAHYDRLHLHTVKRYSSLPFSPWPDETPVYPSRGQMVAYLERYADQHRISPRFGVEVRRVSRDATGFTVETSAGRLRPRLVIVATGYNRVPQWPDLPGLEGFGGTVVHAQAYRNPQPYAGRRTLVVGCGNSGAEIALDLAEHGVDVAMVVRGPVHVVPRDLFGRPSQETSVRLSRLPVAVRDALAAPILRLVVGDLSRWGIVRPGLGPNRLIEEAGRLPLLDIGTIAHVKAGRIRVVPAVEAVLPHGVRFVGGATQAFDAMILATGYRPGLDRMIDGFASVSDAHGRPHRFGEETGMPGLFFVGFRTTATGALREIALEAPRVASAIAASHGARAYFRQ